MNRTDHLERELTAWFADTAAPRVPDFTDDILRLTAGTRQRPRWSFPERWLPMRVITLGRQTFKPLPWRTIGLLAVLALLIAAAVAFYVGSQPRLPAPFGLAANGLVAYAQNGDIFTVDPTTGAREAITTGPDTDQEPRWSLDGTRIAFLRVSGSGHALVIVNRQNRQVVAATNPLIEADSDSLAWSPDGRSIAVAALDGAQPKLYLVDASNGDMKALAADYLGLDVYWRPPDGRQLMYFGGSEPDVGLFMVNLDDGKVNEIARPARPSGVLRPSGWTSDGRRVVFTRGNPDLGRVRTHVVNLTTGDEVIIDAGHGHVSNDGRRIVALDESDRLCVADLGGGPCVLIGEFSQAYGPSHAAGAHWSPDDQWIISRPASGGAVVVDPDGGTQAQPSWIADGAESWQRLAP